ncbi:hypothetical protein Tco_1050635, partial [Tanacetum coccineum]
GRYSNAMNDPIMNTGNNISKRTFLAVLSDVAALGELCLAALTDTCYDFVETDVGTKFLLGCG